MFLCYVVNRKNKYDKLFVPLHKPENFKPLQDANLHLTKDTQRLEVWPRQRGPLFDNNNKLKLCQELICHDWEWCLPLFLSCRASCCAQCSPWR